MQTILGILFAFHAQVFEELKRALLTGDSAGVQTSIADATNDAKLLLGVDQTGRSLLAIAAFMGDQKSCERLVEADAEIVRVRGPTQTNALHEAVRNNRDVSFE